MAKKRGIYTIVQYYNHPITGEVLFNEDMLSVARNHKCIKKCYFIIHDRDVYHQSDIDKQRERLQKEYINRQNEFVNEDGTVSISCDAYIEQEMATTYSYIKIGELKGKHIHVVIFTGNSAIDTADLAAWFGVPENLVDIIPKGRGNSVFFDCLRYLTHETPNAIKDGKFIYNREDVFCFGEDAIGFEEELAEYERLTETYGQVLSEEEAMCMDVLQKGKTPEQCAKENPLLYIKLRDRLKKLYGDYLESLPQPAYRLNFHIDGTGGEGKWQFMVALARSLFPEITSDADLYFKVGGKNVTFEGYTGQPVIIWDDFRAVSLIQVFGDRGKFFDAFNTFPERDSKLKEHVKFAHTNLVNRVNIVNSVEPWDKFLDGLAGEYEDKEGRHYEAEDKKQPYRRFPMIFRLHLKDYDIMINKGFLEGTKEFFQYITYEHIRGNFYQIADACKQNGALKREIASRYISPAVEQIRCLEDTVTKQKMSDDEIRKQYSDYGYDFDKLYDEAKKEDEERMKPELLKKFCETNNANHARFWEIALSMWRFKIGDFCKEPSTEKEKEEVEEIATMLSVQFNLDNKVHNKCINLLGIEGDRMPKGEAELLAEANIVKMLLDAEAEEAKAEEPSADMVAEFEEAVEESDKYLDGVWAMILSGECA